MEPQEVEQLFKLEGSLALQIALLLAIAAMGSALMWLYRASDRRSGAQYKELMEHHSAFAREVREERAQWHGTMVGVVRDNTAAMTAVREAVNSLKDVVNLRSRD